MENKRKYAKRLSVETTLKIIEARKKLNYLFIQKLYDRKTSWEMVASEADVEIDANLLWKKWSNLQHTYQNLLEPHTGSGTSSGEVTAANWPFFSAMHEWASSRHNIHPPFLISREEGEEFRHEESAMEELDETLVDFYVEEIGNQPSTSTPNIVSSPESGTSKSSSTTSLSRSSNKNKNIEIIANSCLRMEEKMNSLYKDITKVLKTKFVDNLREPDSD